MEIRKSSRGSRTRVLVAALALGLVIGVYAMLSNGGASSTSETLFEKHNGAPGMPSGESRVQSPGQESGLRPDSRPGISLAPAGFLETAWKQSTARMKYLDHCQQTTTCSGFDNSEPSSYDLDVRKQTARELRDFTLIALAWKKQRGGDLPEEAQTVARYFLSTGNDDVKEEALVLIGLAPSSRENLHVALSALQGSASGPLMTSFLKGAVATWCSERDLSPQCVSFIRERFQIGGEGVRKALARQSLAITNEYTAPLLAKLEKRQDPRSQVALYLRLNNEEFARFQRGG